MPETKEVKHIKLTDTQKQFIMRHFLCVEGAAQ